MGNEHAKPSDRLKTIEKDVKSLSSSFRGSKNGISEVQKARIVESLAKYSNDANALRGKVKDKYVDDIQRNITYTMNEVLTCQNDNLDQGAVETNSIVQMPLDKRLSLPKNSVDIPIRKVKSSETALYKHTVPTIQDIETKLKMIRPKIKEAIDNKDSMQLRLHLQTIKVLATDLEMIDVMDQTPLGDKKEKLVAVVTNQYQKISKAMKEIRRSKDLNYLANQNKKEMIENELEDIRKSLEGTDLLLKRALKNEDIKCIKSAEDSLRTINQRLNKAEVIDEETTNLKLHMSDKILFLEKYIKEVTKKGSQSDLTRAQSSYEDLIKTIATGRSKNNNDIQVKLESLHSFVENIKDDEENSLKRKEKLLNHIKESVALVKDDKLVKKNIGTVEVGKHQAIAYRPYTKQVADISKMWYSLKSKLSVERIDKDDLKQIDELLYGLQTSIADIRNSFRKNKSKLQSNLNYSTPNLTSPALVKKYASSLSVDGITDAPSRTEIITQNTHEAQDNILQGQIIKNSHLTEKDTFSEIEEIKTQVYYVKEKFPESNHKQHLINKLESYLQILQEYAKSENTAISNNARLVVSDINEILRTITIVENYPSQQHTSVEDNFENIVAVQDNVEELAKFIHKFSSTTYDPTYKAIRERLVQNREYLESIQIPNQYVMINQQKIEVLKKIEYLVETLDRKATNTYSEDSVMTTSKKKLNSLKDKVNRFSGAYKGVLYNQIEKDLNKLLVEACEKIDNRQQSEEITKDAEKYLKILEHRATREQSFRQGIKNQKTEDENSFSKLKHELINIKHNIDNTPSTGVDMFLGLKSRLDLVKLGLDQLKCLRDDDYHQRDFLYNEVETLRNFVDAKIALSQKALEQFPLEDSSLQKVIDKLDAIEESFRKLVPEIKLFIGTKSDEKFYKLDEASIKLILKMDEIDFPIGSDLQKRKLNLLREIYHYGELLENRAKDTETLIQFESDIQDIENNFDRYTKSPKELNKLSEKVKALKTNLENNSLNTILRDRKKKCIYRFHEMVNKIEKNGISKEIALIEADLKIIEKDIEYFDGMQSDKRFYELDELISQYFIKLDNLSIPENSTLFKKKLGLLKQIQTYSHLLNRKVIENEMCEDIRYKLNRLKKKLDKFDGTVKDLASIEIELKNLESKINNLSFKNESNQELIKMYGDLAAKIKSVKRRSETTENFKGISTFLDNERKYQTVKEETINQVDIVSPTLIASEIVEVAKEQYSQDLKNVRKSLVPESQNGETPENAEDEIQIYKKSAKSKANSTSAGIHSDSTGTRTQSNQGKEDLFKIESDFRQMIPEIRNFLGTSADDKYNQLEESSTKLILKLDDMEFAKDSELFSRKVNLLKEIFKFDDLLAKRAKDTETLIQYETDIKDIENNFNKYSNSNIDLEKLLEKVRVLKLNLNVNSLNTLLRDRREICIDKVKKILDQLESQGGRANSTENVSNIEKEFKGMMKEIERFSGIHNDKRCQELDLILVKLFSQLDLLKIHEESELFKRKSFLLREIQNYRQILEKRATENEFYREIRKKIEIGKNKVDSFGGDLQDLKLIEGELKTLQTEIDEANIRDTLRQELKQRLGALLTKYKILQKKFKMQSTSTGHQAKSYKEYLEFKLNELEGELNSIQQRVSAFCDVEGSEEYQVLEDSLRNMSSKIKKLDVPSESQYYNRKIELKTKTVDCLTQLDERVESIETIIDIEKDLEMVREKVEKKMTDQEKNNLDEKLIALQVKLSKLKVQDDLVDRRSTCENSAFLIMRKLKEKAEQSSEEENSGTFI